MKISKYVLYDILRSKIILAYTLFLFVVSISMFQMEENSSKAMLSLLNVVLFHLEHTDRHHEKKQSIGKNDLASQYIIQNIF